MTLDKNVNILYSLKNKEKICHGYVHEVRNAHLNAKQIGVDARVYKHAGKKSRVISFEIGLLYSRAYRYIKIADDYTYEKNYSIMQNYIQI